MLNRPTLAAFAAIAALAGGVLGALAVAGPAGAVVGGETIAADTVPWFASINGCGGVLVAPDRVATAGHCVRDRSMQDLQYVDVGGTRHKTARVAMHPGWRHDNGDDVLDDVAIMQLDQPVAAIAPVTLGSANVAQATILGRGRSTPPGSGANETFDFELRGATLRLMSDGSCAEAWKHQKGNSGESFDAARMLCAIDVDGRAPLSSGCDGDSGGPLYTGTPAAPVVLGFVSWGGSRCGADHLPSVFADAARYRSFLLSPSPTWAPLTADPAQLTGTKAVGHKLSCRTSGFTGRPTKLEYTWQRQGGRTPVNVGHAKRYTVRKADAGHVLVCSVIASNDGGILSVPAAVAHIPR
jgi:secreted trypsin-like serine protease